MKRFLVFALAAVLGAAFLACGTGAGGREKLNEERVKEDAFKKLKKEGYKIDEDSFRVSGIKQKGRNSAEATFHVKLKKGDRAISGKFRSYYRQTREGLKLRNIYVVDKKNAKNFKSSDESTGDDKDGDDKGGDDMDGDSKDKDSKDKDGDDSIKGGALLIPVDRLNTDLATAVGAKFSGLKIVGTPAEKAYKAKDGLDKVECKIEVEYSRDGATKTDRWKMIYRKSGETYTLSTVEDKAKTKLN